MVKHNVEIKRIKGKTMEHEVYEARIFEMRSDPITKRETICLEIELGKFDFDEIKEHWVDNETISIRFNKEA